MPENAVPSLADIPAVLLVGGLGTRLRSVLPDKPKALASLGARPFLDLLLEQLEAQGIQQVLLCTGYLAEQMERVLAEARRRRLNIACSREPEPLGTAGAIAFARAHLEQSPAFLVLNGDSFLEIDLPGFLAFHLQQNGLATLATVRVPDSARYGTVELSDEGRVLRFLEKTGVSCSGLINGGAYLFSPAIFDYIPPGRANFETDVFPRILSRGVHAQEQHGIFIDIGIPEDYARAQQLYSRLERAARGGSHELCLERKPEYEYLSRADRPIV
ncbi:MAG TPA: nucleotidyltransferase family protein [Bryobacteraceae bacterium]|jgi:NDP-sugar pyrophosphorylase family protein|nr:nucleotidyltransferase family protein [Bryobacteraceae bacterium]